MSKYMHIYGKRKSSNNSFKQITITKKKIESLKIYAKLQNILTIIFECYKQNLSIWTAL